MRITAEAKADTWQRIVDAATRLSPPKAGSDDHLASPPPPGSRRAPSSTTSESKEAIVAALILPTPPRHHAQQDIRAGTARTNPRGRTVYAHLDGADSSGVPTSSARPRRDDSIPLRQSFPAEPRRLIRVNHFEAVERIIVGYGVPGPLSAMTMQLY